MPTGGAVDTRPASALPPALLEARRLNAAAQFEAAKAMAAPLFPAARDAGDWCVAAEAALVMARASGNQRAIDEALAQVPQLTSAEAVETAYSGLTAVYSELGLTGLAVACGRHALEHAELSHDVARVCMARTNFLIIACVACEQALEPDPPLAQRLLAEMRPQLERLRTEVQQVATPLSQARLLRVLGSLALCEERWADAAQAFEQLTGFAGQLPPPLLCSAWIELGQVQARLGQHDAAYRSGLQAQACNPVPEAPRRWVDLRRLALVKNLIGQPQEAFLLLRRSHDRRHHIVMSALESRAATLSARLDEQSLRVENEGLRRSNASLRASVADIERLAETDPLTGLLNRRGLDKAWAGLAGPSGQHRVLGMVDVDHFKRVNDGHSHVVGDAVLRQVARLMNHELRGSDRMARYGGEEFAAVVLGADAAAAAQVFERLRRVVEAHDWSMLAPGLAVTVSIGAVRVPRGEPFDAAVARADRLLYQAKAGGRNRVVAEVEVGGEGAP